MTVHRIAPLQIGIAMIVSFEGRFEVYPHTCNGRHRLSAAHFFAARARIRGKALQSRASSGQLVMIDNDRGLEALVPACRRRSEPDFVRLDPLAGRSIAAGCRGS